MFIKDLAILPLLILFVVGVEITSIVACGGFASQIDYHLWYTAHRSP